MYLVTGPAVFRRVAQQTKCPAALLHTLMTVHVLTTLSPLPPSATALQATLQSSLPLLRGYIRALVERGCIRRERYSRRGARRLHLTSEGRALVQLCQRETRRVVALLG
jgi:DNA-binding MarR family transcriptional regulator